MPTQDETLVLIALNVLSGIIDPKEWKGLRSLDEDDEALLEKFQAVRQSGFGKLEVIVLHSQLETCHQVLTFKRKDLIRPSLSQ